MASSVHLAQLITSITPLDLQQHPHQQHHPYYYRYPYHHHLPHHCIDNESSNIVSTVATTITTTTTTVITTTIAASTTTITSTAHNASNSSHSGRQGAGDGGEGGGGGVEAEEGEEVMAKVCYLLGLSLVIVLGNILVIVSVVRYRDMHRVSNYFLVSLATADLMVGVFNVPLFILWLLKHDVFLHESFCNLTLLACLFVIIASQLNVIVVTIERYTAVCHPFRHRRLLLSNPEMVGVAISSVWLVSLGATCLSSMAMDKVNTECSFYSLFDTTFLLTSVIVGVFLPFALIVVLNLQMLVKIRSSCVFKQNMYQPADQRRGSVMGALSKATTMVMMVCCLFLLAWTPFFTVILIHTFCTSCHLRQALDVILLFAFTNSAWNPVVYALCNRMFRRAYKRILLQSCCRCNVSLNNSLPESAKRDSVTLPLATRSVGEGGVQ